MPPNTAVPTAYGRGTGAGGDNEGTTNPAMKAKDVIITARTEAQPGARDRGDDDFLSLPPLLHRELDDQDRVLSGQCD
jgi:hypothetical protein